MVGLVYEFFSGVVFNEIYGLVSRELSMEVDKLRLIEEVRKRPILWDVRVKKVEHNWGEVADILGTGISTCQLVWKSLRCSYCAEKKNIENRIAKAKRNGTYHPNNKYCTWHLFESLKFAFDDSDDEIEDSEHCSQLRTNIEKHDSEDKSSTTLNTQNNPYVKEEPELQIDADTYPEGSEDSNESLCLSSPLLVEKNSNELSQSSSLNDQSKHDNNLKLLKEDISKSAIDINELDYSFLISFLYHMKLMSEFQKLQFRARMSNLMLEISSDSTQENTLENKKLLVDVGDPDGNFLISFWPFLNSLPWSENLQFRAKLVDEMSNILSEEVKKDNNNENKK